MGDVPESQRSGNRNEGDQKQPKKGKNYPPQPAAVWSKHCFSSCFWNDTRLPMAQSRTECDGQLNNVCLPTYDDAIMMLWVIIQ